MTPSVKNNRDRSELKLSVSGVTNALTLQKSMGIVARHCLGGGPATARTASHPLQNPRRTTTLGVRHFMKKVLCLIAALTLALSSLGCTKIRARMEIKAANEAYQKEDYAGALPHYQKARQIHPSFPDLDRLVGYSEIGLSVLDDISATNERHADRAIQELNNYLKKRPDDRIARDALINMYLNANRTSQTIDFFRTYLATHPRDLEAVKSIATLYAKQGNYNESRNWY